MKHEFSEHWIIKYKFINLISFHMLMRLSLPLCLSLSLSCSRRGLMRFKSKNNSSKRKCHTWTIHLSASPLRGIRRGWGIVEGVLGASHIIIKESPCLFSFTWYTHSYIVIYTLSEYGESWIERRREWVKQRVMKASRHIIHYTYLILFCNTKCFSILCHIIFSCKIFVSFCFVVVICHRR